MVKCYYCYRQIPQPGMHPECSKKMFGTPQVPHLETTEKEIERFAQGFLNRRLSITGVQKKLSLHLDAKANERFTIVGALGGNYILKPPSQEFDQLPELEDLTMHLAAVCGLKTALHCLTPMRDGKLAYITKRFDRNGHRKWPQEDACQLSGTLTENKYRSSHERLGDTLKKFSSFPGDDALRLWELIVFSFITGNADMHLKNFSLQRNANGHYLLTPAYDLIPTRLLLSVKEDPEELALTLNGKKNKLQLEDFLQLANRLAIPEKVRQRVLSRFFNAQGAMTELIDSSFVNPKLKEDYKALIANRLDRLKEHKPEPREIDQG